MVRKPYQDKQSRLAWVKAVGTALTLMGATCALVFPDIAYKTRFVRWGAGIGIGALAAVAWLLPTIE